MPLCEKLFLHDSLACLDLLDAEAQGLLERTRREYCLVYTERFLDLLRFSREQRIEVYRKTFHWAIDGEDWSPDDRALLEQRYRGLEASLVALLCEGDEEAAFGGARAAEIARRCLDASRPAAEALLAGLSSGRVVQDPVQLAWSLCHMHCNRIGLDVHAEAVLRYFTYRLHQEDLIPLGRGEEQE
jgi:thiopeptide-type bacteriocin biosynthesis protein